jgi:transposase
MKKLTTTMMQQTLNKQDRRLTVGLDLGDRSSFIACSMKQVTS